MEVKISMDLSTNKYFFNISDAVILSQPTQYVGYRMYV